MKNRALLLDCLLALIGCAAIFCAPFIGILELDLPSLLRGTANEIQLDVFWRLRIPRVAAGFLIGGALAFCGVVFQALFHNPLASPFTLGVSSGATFGAAISIVFGVAAPEVLSMLGALLTIALVFWAGRSRFGLESTGMLLMGVVVNFFFGSLVVFFQYMSDLTELFSLMRWLMGNLEITSPALLPLLAALLLAAILWYAAHGIELDLLSLGDELALARGVAVERKRAQLFLLCSLLVALAVTIAGPIGFVGIVVPHFCRILYGPSHRGLIVRSAWVGGIALVVCDAIGRTITPPAEIPVGVVTAVIGAPIFIFLLLYRRR